MGWFKIAMSSGAGIGLLFLAPSGAQAREEAADSISSKLVNNRMREIGSWRIEEDGTGVVEIKPYLGAGLDFQNLDTGIGIIRFAEGLHRFDIGHQGYAAVKAELKGILEGKPDPFKGIALDCGVRHPGYSEVSWYQNRQSGAFEMVSSLCALPPEIDALRVSKDKAWFLIGRLMLRYGQAGVSEELKHNEPLVRTPYKLSVRFADVMPNRHIEWEISPDGSGWFQTNENATYQTHSPNPSTTRNVLAGRYALNIGNEGYLTLRRELDAYILGSKGAKDCPIVADDGPVVQLRWQEKGKQVGERNNDDFCVDSAERLRLTNNYLGAQVAEKPVLLPEVPSAPAPVSAPAAALAPSPGVDEIRFSYEGVRTATLLSWKIDANGRGEVQAQLPLGWTVANTDLGVGDYRFAQGMYRFDIGQGGYRAVKAALHDFIFGNATKVANQQIGGMECFTGGDLSSRIISWSVGEAEHRVALRRRSEGCVSADDIRLSEQMEEARRVIARAMLLQGHPAVSETMPNDVKPVTRSPLNLELSYAHIFPNRYVDWKVAPDGKGWFRTNQDLSWADPSGKMIEMNFVKRGKHRFDIGKAGYLQLRRALDAYITGPASKTGCIPDGLSATDQPIATLRWQEKGKWIRSGQTDAGCNDYGGRVSWTISYLVAKLGKPTVNRK
jgi:hypothetical protein